MAAVTIGFCPSGHEDMAVAVQPGHGHDAGAHAQHGDGSPTQPAGPSCNVCAEHCSSATVVPSVDSAIDARPLGPNRTHLTARSALAVDPDRLDRPPLA